MNKFRFTIHVLAIAICMFAFASFAQAQATRTWVSGVGDDVNPCSRTAPCKTWAGAISKTAAGGEIDTIDPGGFGTLTITKSITIDGLGSMSSCLGAGTNCFNVNGAGVIARLRNISVQGTINGSSPGVNGINFTNGAALYVEDSIIEGFATTGINIPSSTQSNILSLRNVIIRNCGTGINISNTGAQTTTLEFDNVNISRSAGNGITAGAGTVGAITRSVIATNNGSGIAASTGTTDFSIVDTTIMNSSTGISTGASSHVRIARCLITGNTNALGLGGSVDTGGNNTIMGNTNNQDPNGALFQQK